MLLGVAQEVAPAWSWWLDAKAQKTQSGLQHDGEAKHQSGLNDDWTDGVRKDVFYDDPQI